MPLPTRVVNGKFQIWNDDRMDWEEAQKEIPELRPPEPDKASHPMQQQNLFFDASDWVIRLADDPTQKKSKPVFICGACGSDVDKIVLFKGWEHVSIDRDCGDETDVLDRGQERIH